MNIRSALILVQLFVSTLLVGSVLIRVRQADGSMRRLEVDESLTVSKLKAVICEAGMILNVTSAKLKLRTGNKSF
jgi:hypothetical protein